MASRSPEQHRRPSYILGSTDDAFKLPPIQSLPSVETEAPVGQDSSVVVDTDHGPQTLAQHADAEKVMQQVADNREPAYIRQEPTTTQIRQPSPVETDRTLTAEPHAPTAISEESAVTAEPRVQHVATAEQAALTESSLAQSDKPTLDTPASPAVDASDLNSATPVLDTPATDNSTLYPTKPNDESATTPFNAPSPLANLKQEHSAHTNSPLRESSVPVPSTEMPTLTPASTPTVPRKRPPPKSATAKKGTASKKEPAQKKRKTDHALKRSDTPSSQKSKAAGARKLASTSATPAPRSIRNASSPPRSIASADQDVEGEAQYSENDDEEDQGTPDPDAELYCLCRKPDTGTFMIGCDGGCDDWFHGKCVQIAERDKGLIDRYVCPRCTEKGIGFTTWKRMCRRSGCRMPARTPGSAAAKKGKKEENISKFCSHACGVQYFKELLAQTRGASESLSHSSRSKKTAANSPPLNDLGPRGGALSAGELKALVTVSTGIDDFKRLGEGILSPPATPSTGRRDKNDESQPSSLLTSTEQERLEDITAKKDATRARHALLKDRIKFITMIKQTATNLAESRKLKPKEFCGFDPRMTWTEEELQVWRSSPEGTEALKSGEMPLPATADAEGDTEMVNGADGEGHASNPADICDKKKCARHHDWAKLALDDTRFEMSENSEVMRGLDKEEKDMLQRAGLRARMLQAGGTGGVVILHEEESPAAAVAAQESEPEHEAEHLGKETSLAVASPTPLPADQEQAPEVNKAVEGKAVNEQDAKSLENPVLPTETTTETQQLPGQEQQQQQQQQQSEDVDMVDASA